MGATGRASGRRGIMARIRRCCDAFSDSWLDLVAADCLRLRRAPRRDRWGRHARPERSERHDQNTREPRSARRDQCSMLFSWQAVSGRAATGQVAPLSAGARSSGDTRAATPRVAATTRALEAGQRVRPSSARGSGQRSSFATRAAIRGRMVARKGPGPERRPVRSGPLEPTGRARAWRSTAMRTPTPRESIGCRVSCAYMVGDARRASKPPCRACSSV